MQTENLLIAQTSAPWRGPEEHAQIKSHGLTGLLKIKSLISKLKAAQVIISFCVFMGKARTVLEAGLALNTHGSLAKYSVDHLLQLHGESVNSLGNWLGLNRHLLGKGIVLLRAGRAGFLLSFTFKGFIAEHLELSADVP